MVNAQYRMEGDAIRTIEYAHVAVHDDKFAIANDYQANVDIASPLTYLMVGPTGLELHIVFDIQTSGAVLAEMYTGPTYSDEGTAVRHFRPNLWSVKDITSTYRAPTVSDDGTLVWQTRTPGTSTNPTASRIGGNTRNGEEIILPAGEALLIRLTPAANDTIISFVAEYYEVPDGMTNPRRS